MTQTHVLAWTTLASWRRCVTERSLATLRNEGTASVHCWKWDSFSNLMHMWCRSANTNFVFELTSSSASSVQEASRVICGAVARCFCWFRGKSVLQHMHPAKCPISAVKKKGGKTSSRQNWNYTLWILEPPLPRSDTRESMTSPKYQTVS